MVTIKDLQQLIYEMSTHELDLYFIIVSIAAFESMWKEFTDAHGEPAPPENHPEGQPLQRNLCIDGRVIIPWFALNNRPGYALILKQVWLAMHGIQVDSIETDIDGMAAKAKAELEKKEADEADKTNDQEKHLANLFPGPPGNA